jgi:hypothetical protein
MHLMVVAVSVLLYAAGLCLLAGAVALARESPARAQRKNRVMVLGSLLYGIAAGLAWGWQVSITAAGVQPSLFALCGWITATVGMIVLLTVSGLAVFRRRLWIADSTRWYDILAHRIVTVSGLVVIVSGVLWTWSDWQPWAEYLHEVDRIASAMTGPAIIAFLAFGWRLIFSIFTTGKVPDEFKTGG